MGNLSWQPNNPNASITNTGRWRLLIQGLLYQRRVALAMFALLNGSRSPYAESMIVQGMPPMPIRALGGSPVLA
jgi:hypothetical protein